MNLSQASTAGDALAEIHARYKEGRARMAAAATKRQTEQSELIRAERARIAEQARLASLRVLNLYGIPIGPNIAPPPAQHRAWMIIAECRAKHNVTIQEILGVRRVRQITDARQEAMARMYAEIQEWSLPQIGRFFGGKDHTTIIHAAKKFNLRLSRDVGPPRGAAALCAEIGGGE